MTDGDAMDDVFRPRGRPITNNFGTCSEIGLS